jgi:hypothetical protein
MIMKESLNNSTIIKKMNNYLSLQIIFHVY